MLSLFTEGEIKAERLSDVPRIDSPLRAQPAQLTPEHTPPPGNFQTHCYTMPSAASTVVEEGPGPHRKREREKRSVLNTCCALISMADSSHASSPLILHLPSSPMREAISPHTYLLREVKKLSEGHLSPDLFEFISSALSQLEC